MWKAFTDYLDKMDETGQKNLLQDFWSLVGKDDPDATMLRFLRARNFVVKNAFDMILGVLKWRREFNVDHIIENGETVLSKFLLSSYSVCVHKTDKGGRPVIYFKAHLYDLSKFTLDDAKKFLIHTMEFARNHCLDDKIDTVTVIFYMGKFGLRNFDMGYVSFLVSALQDNYPEMLQQCILMDAPGLFSMVWPLVKKLLAPAVADKIKFLKLKDIEDEIDLNSLPKELGGKDESVLEYIPAEQEPVDQDTNKTLQDKRATINKAYIEATKDWIADGEEAAERRAVLQREHYALWKVMHSHRPKTNFHRLNLIDKESLLLKWNK